jgi:hypothetical protein
MIDQTRRDLIALREKHGADSPIGHRCSNLVELIQMASPPAELVKRQMSDLQRLLTEHRGTPYAPNVFQEFYPR